MINAFLDWEIQIRGGMFVNLCLSYFNLSHVSWLLSPNKLESCWYTWWSTGYFARLGHGDQSDQNMIPERDLALAGVHVKSVSWGQYHTTVCTEDGHQYTFGCGKYGKRGHANGDTEDNKDSPVLLVQDLKGKKHKLKCSVMVGFILWLWPQVVLSSHGEIMSMFHLDMAGHTS